MCALWPFIKKNYRFLIFLFTLSLLIRGLFFFLFMGKEQNYMNYDTKGYNNIAVQIVKGKGITNLDNTPSFYRVPGYAFFLSACYNIFGIDTKKALWVQIFFASFIPVLIFILSVVLIPYNLILAKIASIFCSLHLGLVLFSGYAMTETFFMFFLLIFFIFFFKAFDYFFCESLNDKKIKNLFISGVFLGLSSLFRPVGHYLLIVSILMLIFTHGAFNIRIKKIILFFFGWFIVVLGWITRNYLLTGMIFFTTLSGIHFLKHLGARIVMEKNSCSYAQATKKIFKKWEELKFKEIEKKGIALNQAEICNIAEKLTIKYLIKNLTTGLKLIFINIFKTCFSLYSSELFYITSKGNLPSYDRKALSWGNFRRFLLPEGASKYLVFAIYFEIITFMIILIGFLGFVVFALFDKNYFCLFFKLLPFIGLFIFITLACGFARLRLPIEPLLILLSLKFWLERFFKKGLRVANE